MNYDGMKISKILNILEFETNLHDAWNLVTINKRDLKAIIKGKQTRKAKCVHQVSVPIYIHSYL